MSYLASFLSLSCEIMLPKEISNRLDGLEAQVCQQLRDFAQRLNTLTAEPSKQQSDSGLKSDCLNLSQDLSEFQKTFDSSMDILRCELRRLEENLRRQDERLDDLEQYSRRNCLLIHGVPETTTEDTTDVVIQLFRDKLKVNIDTSTIDRCHRVGKPHRTVAEATKQGKRAIIVKFISYQHRLQVFRAKRALKNSPVVITESLTTQRQQLLKAAKDKFGPRNCWTYDGKITVLRGNKRVHVFTQTDLENIA